MNLDSGDNIIGESTELFPSITGIPIGTRYDIRLDGSINESSGYRKEFFLLENATEKDVIHIHIDSFGGCASTAIQFCNKIRNCKAKVVGELEADALSAGSIIFLQCHTWVVHPFTNMMCHNGQNWFGGKSNNTADQAKFQWEQTKEFLRYVYSGFLSEKEIEQMFEGKDIWLNSSQVVERLDYLLAHRDGEMLQYQMEELEKAGLYKLRSFCSSYKIDYEDSETEAELREKLVDIMKESL